MAEVTDPNILRRLQATPAPQPTAPQVRPQPFPGVKVNPLKTSADARADTQTQLAIKAAGREQKRLEMEAQRLGLTLKQYQDELAKRQANGGFDTTVDQSISGGHVTALQTELDILNDVRGKDPLALKPSWGEKVVSSFTSDPDYISFTKNPQRQRASNAYRNIIESVLWLKTGAAYNKEQLEGQLQALVPQMNDGPEALADKALRLKANIEAARVRAGPANAMAQKALDNVEAMMGDMYSVGRAHSTGEQAPVALSGTTKSVPVPQAMQDEYAKAMSAIPPGQLTPERYRALIGELYRRHGYEPGDNPSEAALIDQFNKTGKFEPIGATQENLTGLAKVFAQAGADKGLLGDLYAGGMNYFNAAGAGVPRYMAGEGGRLAADAANAEHPKSALAGDIAGSIAPTMALEAGIGKLVGKASAPAEIIANTLYGGAKGSLDAGGDETAGMWGMLGGAGGAVVGRGVVKGARGFLGKDKSEAIDNMLAEQQFQIPGRDPLPVTEATPAQFQGLDDAALRQELERAQQGRQAWDAYDQQKLQVAQDEAKTRAAMEAKFSTQLTLNAAAKQRYIEAKYAGGHILQADRVKLERQAEELYPTTIEGLAKKYPDEVGTMFRPQVSEPNFEPRGVLQQREEILQDYLSRSAEPKTGTVPGVDLTTPSRMGGAELEGTFSGLPIIRGAHNAQIESWNRRSVAESLKDAGIELPENVPAGAEAMGFAKKALGDRYNALLAPIKGEIAPDFLNQVAALNQMGRTIQKKGLFRRQWQHVEDILDDFRANGKFTGESYKTAKSRLEDLAANWAAKDLSGTQSSLTEAHYQEGAQLIQDVLAAMEGQVAKADPVRAKQLLSLNKAWAKYIRLEMASTIARDNGGIFAPDQLMEAYYKLDPSRRRTQFVTGSLPGMDWVKQSQLAVGSHSRPTSVWQTLIAPLGLAGSVTLKPAVAGLTALGGTAAYAPGVKRITQALIDGKLGRGADAVSRALGKPVPNLAEKLPGGSDLLQAMIAQTLRNRTQEK